MKRYVLLLFVLTGSMRLFGQCCPYMGNITVIPEFPSGNEAVKIVTLVTTPNQGALLDHELTVDGFVIEITACYYEGMATTPKSIRDTLDAGVLAPGNYTVQFTAYNSIYGNQCTISDTQYTEEVFAVGATGLPEPEEFNVVLYPNPATNFVRLPEAMAGEGLYVYGSDGRLLYAISADATNDMRIDVTHLHSGMYYLIAGNRRFRFVKD